MADSRMVKEGKQVQGIYERIRYIINTSEWSTSTPTSATLRLIDMDDLSDVTATKSTGSCSISTTYITTPLIHSLVAGHNYRAYILFVVDTNTLETFIWIEGE